MKARVARITSWLMILAGVVAFLSAAGNDDLYGPAYPTWKMALTLAIGIVLLYVGGKGVERNAR